MTQLSVLNEKREKLITKIGELEFDLKKSLRKDEDDNALDEEHREILNGVYKVEKENLKNLDAEIESIKLAIR
jgi:DNA-binding transcriptional regulator GbsR (MarR family)